MKTFQVTSTKQDLCTASGVFPKFLTNHNCNGDAHFTVWTPCLVLFDRVCMCLIVFGSREEAVIESCLYDRVYMRHISQ